MIDLPDLFSEFNFDGDKVVVRKFEKWDEPVTNKGGTPKIIIDEECGPLPTKPLNPLFTEDRVCAICHVRTGCHQCCVKCLAAVCPRKVVVCPEYHPDEYYKWRCECRDNPEFKKFIKYFINREL
jgi:hypothetical protein